MPKISRTAVAARVVWEAFLFVVAVIVVVVATASERSIGSNLAALLATTGLSAIALALSLRTATPNLAVGGIAAAAGLMTVKLIDAGWSLWPAAAVALLAALIVGAILGLVIAVLDLPAWAASLGLLAVVSTVMLGVTSNSDPVVSVPDRAYPAHGLAIVTVLAVLAVVGSLAGGGLWLFPGVRATLGLDRSAGAERGPRIRAALLGCAGSSVIAALAGVVSVFGTGASTYAGGVPMLSLAIVLLGGVSVYGRRGGVAGTVLATVVLGTFYDLMVLHGASSWIAYGLPEAVGIGIGLMLSAGFRALEGTTPVALTDQPVDTQPIDAQPVDTQPIDAQPV